MLVFYELKISQQIFLLNSVNTSSIVWSRHSSREVPHTFLRLVTDNKQQVTTNDDLHHVGLTESFSYKSYRVNILCVYSHISFTSYPSFVVFEG